MPLLCIKPSQLQGEITIPPSKSHTLRALLFAMMAKSESIIHNYLDSPDTFSMIEAMKTFGCEVTVFPKKIEVRPNFHPAQDVINAGNSGIVFRFISALAALLPTYTVVTGDHSIRYQRPVVPLLKGLEGLGAFAVASRENKGAPVIIKGPIKAGNTYLEGEDSQPVSALLIASSFLSGSTCIEVSNPGEKPWIDLTLAWLKRLGLVYEHQNYERYKIYGPLQYSGFEFTVPGDFTSAAYPMVAALVTNSELSLRNLDREDTQGDKKIVEILIKMGAKIYLGSDKLTIQRGSRLRGITIDINQCIDALPILAVLGCYAEGTTEIVNAAVARKKESDRISCIATELKKMGACVEEKEEGLKIQGAPLYGSKLISHKDHRLVLALSVAALGAEKTTFIEDTSCVAKSYPSFVKDFVAIGANIEEF